ncbi:hypothetical protein OAH12_01400 [Cyclobacteriaceae bacterium]|nr:hypothetical protein [Cyclobacteriaceae bacterium]
MFKKIGIRYRSKKAISKRNSSGAQLASPVQAAGIVTTSDIAHSEDFKSFTDQLASRNIDLEILIFTQEKSEEIAANHFNKKDFNWSGKIKSEKVNKFIKTPFDFLFSINTSSNLQIENILALSKAKCRIGSKIDDLKNNLDFVIQLNDQDSVQDLTNNILLYTENIHS